MKDSAYMEAENPHGCPCYCHLTFCEQAYAVTVGGVGSSRLVPRGARMRGNTTAENVSCQFDLGISKASETFRKGGSLNKF